METFGFLAIIFFYFIRNEWVFLSAERVREMIFSDQYDAIWRKLLAARQKESYSLLVLQFWKWTDRQMYPEVFKIKDAFDNGG